jgi:cytochrome c oxidase cbb3-type subunit 3
MNCNSGSTSLRSAAKRIAVFLMLCGAVYLAPASACCGGGSANAAPAADEFTNPFRNDHKAAEKGEELFGRNCQQCHNSRAKGGKAPQLVRGAWGPTGANSDLFMYRTIAAGRPGTAMGGFGLSLTGDEIWQVITFLREEARRVKLADAKKSDDDHLY